MVLERCNQPRSPGGVALVIAREELWRQSCERIALEEGIPEIDSEALRTATLRSRVLSSGVYLKRSACHGRQVRQRCAMRHYGKDMAR